MLYGGIPVHDAFRRRSIFVQMCTTMNRPNPLRSRSKMLRCVSRLCQSPCGRCLAQPLHLRQTRSDFLPKCLALLSFVGSCVIHPKPGFHSNLCSHSQLALRVLFYAFRLPKDPLPDVPQEDATTRRAGIVRCERAANHCCTAKPGGCRLPTTAAHEP